MANTPYVYEVRFADKPARQALTGFDNEIGFDGHKTLGDFLRAKYPDNVGITYQVVPPGVAISFPVSFPLRSS